MPLIPPIVPAIRSEMSRLGDTPADVLDWMTAHDDATAFHQPGWMRAVERATGHEALVAWVRRSGEPVAAVPLTLARSRLFGRALVGSGFAVDGGAVVADAAAAAGLSRVVRDFATRERVAVELRGGAPMPEFTSAPPTHVTFARDIAGDRDSLLKAIPRKQRAEVRKSFERNLMVTHSTDSRERAAHHAVYAQSVRNLGTPVFPRALFDAVLDEPGLDSDITVVRDASGTPLSAVLTLYYRGIAIPYWGGGTAAARRERANEALYFGLMEHAVTRGCTRFDFGRSKVGSGPATFKKNWGFEAREVRALGWTPDGVRPRSVDSLSASNAWKTRLWQRLPLSVANRLGPPIARGLA